jgi:hypothetical protein
MIQASDIIASDLLPLEKSLPGASYRKIQEAA